MTLEAGAHLALMANSSLMPCSSHVTPDQYPFTNDAGSLPMACPDMTGEESERVAASAAMRVRLMIIPPSSAAMAATGSWLGLTCRPTRHAA